MTIEFTAKRGESRTFEFTITEDGVIKDCSGGTFFIAFKRYKSDSASLLSKSHASFDVGSIASGKVYVTFSSQDLDIMPKVYYGELKVVLPGSPNIVEKSEDIELTISQSIT